MHADEAMQADRFGTLLEQHAFRYDPSEYHGPLLAYATLPAAWIARQWRYAALSEWTIRAIPAFAGIALALVSLAFARYTGAAAALCTAVSPVLVYYSRDYIPEMLLVLLSAGLLVAIWKYAESLHLQWAVAGGVCAGLMLVTKETAVVVFAAAVAAYLSARFPFRLKGLAAAVLTAIATAALLMRSQTADLARALVIYATRFGSGGAHAHPWYYYFQTLLPSGDIIWLLVGALVFFRVGGRDRTVRFLGTFAVVLTILYSAISYKTPWCAAGPVHAWILTGAAGLSAVERRRRAASQFVAAVVLLMAVQAVRYAFPLAADPRNPYAYAHTTQDVYLIRDRIALAAAAQPDPARTGIDIFAAENWWPLPWYLRRYSQVRWWSAPPREGHPGPVVLCSPANEGAIAHLLYEVPPPGERELFVNLFPRTVWLRPGVEVRGYVAASAAPRE